MKIIAEMCQNHNGKREILLQMLECAAEAGATHAKIQNLYSSELTFRNQFENPNPNKFEMYRPYSTELERLAKLDLTLEDEIDFVTACKSFALIPMTTVFTEYGAERAKNAGFKSIKIASYDSTNFRLINKVNEFATEVVISTGATTSIEVLHLVKFLEEKKYKEKTSLLHCKTEYPNSWSRVHMQRMIWLSEFGFPAGFSDHSETYNSNYEELPTRLLASKVAIYLGAEIIERHFNILSPKETKDGRVSINKFDLSELAQFSTMDKDFQLKDLREYKVNFEEVINKENQDYEPSVEEWLNRSYYKGRVKTSIVNNSN